MRVNDGKMLKGLLNGLFTLLGKCTFKISRPYIMTPEHFFPPLKFYNKKEIKVYLFLCGCKSNCALNLQKVLFEGAIINFVVVRKIKTIRKVLE